VRKRDRGPRTSHSGFWGLVAVVAAVTLPGVWASSLQGCDEAYYAQMARGMLESRDWWVPRYDGTPPFDKPPLLMWLVAGSFRLFGVGDLQARLPGLLLGAVLPFALWAGVPGPAEQRFVAAATLATTLLYVQLQHMVMTDLVAFAGLVAFAVAVLRAEEGSAWGWLAGLGLGVAALAKGPLAGLFVLATLPFAASRRARPPRAGFLDHPKDRVATFGDPGFLARVVPGLLPAAAWYALLWREFGGRFLEVHFGVFLFRLATQGGIVPESPLGPAFYVVSALWRLLPWWPILPAALGLGWTLARRGDGVAGWSVGFAAVYFATITLMRTKHDHYALPLVLPMALLVGSWATSTGPPGRADRASAWLCRALACLLLFGSGAALVGAVPLDSRLRWPAVALATLLGAVYLAAAARLRRGARGAAWGLLLAAAGVAYVAGGAALRPWDTEPGLRAVARQLPPGEAVVYVTDRPVEDNFCEYAALRFRLQGPPRVLDARAFPSAPGGWYAGRQGVLRPGPQDQVVVQEAGWVLVRRP
jgi:4-amino-4-deoxy-L-arabinose transferase-like glycosyltransferase